MGERSPAYPSADRHELEQRAMTELERLPGVIAAAVWVTSDRSLRHARLHTVPGAAHIIVANAAARVLHALDIAVPDPGAIRITPTGIPDDIPMPPAQGGRFLLLQDLNLHRAGAHVSCRVQLVQGAHSSTGEARELDTSAGRLRAVALATLRAAEDSTDGLALGLEAVAITPMFGRSYATVSVEAAVGRRATVLCGMVPVDGSRGAEEAVCMATLRAIDRWAALR